MIQLPPLSAGVASSAKAQARLGFKDGVSGKLGNTPTVVNDAQAT
jgi:hypothetical protein